MPVLFRVMDMQDAYRPGLMMTALLLGVSLAVQAQESIPGKPVVCYRSVVSQPTHHPAPQAAGRLQQQTAHIDLTYLGVPTAAMAAFRQATDMWATLLDTPVAIHIQAAWASLPGNALASTKATTLYRGFTGAAQPDVWYPVTLAEKLVGHDLNGTGQADITITINQNENWYFGLDGNTPANQTDLLSVVLHEVAHGLGFVSAADAKDSTGSLRDTGYLLVYDKLLANAGSVRTATYADPSAALLMQLTSDNLFLDSPAALTGNPVVFPKVFAPPFYNPGGSISHLDEATYPPGDPNALMTPYFAPGESVHTTGPILLGVLADLGWRDTLSRAGEVLVFPNPAADLVTVQVPQTSGLVTLVLSDLIGQVVKTVSTTNASLIQVDVSGLAGGLYLLTISTPARQWRRKLVLLP